MGRLASRQADGSVSATLATSVFERLRADILQGTLAPGEKLRVEALRERYGVGASPVREALNRLVSLHLVEQIDQKGFRVTVIEAGQLRELAQTRGWIAEIAVREAIRSGDAEWEEQIVLAHHRLRKCHEIVTGPNREWEMLHRRFHAALVAACPSRWILDFHEMLFDLADRVRHLAIRREQGARDTMGEHQAIMEAVTSRDEARAVALLKDHFSRTAELAVEQLGPAPDAEAASNLVDLAALKARSGGALGG